MESAGLLWNLKYFNGIGTMFMESIGFYGINKICFEIYKILFESQTFQWNHKDLYGML